MENRVQTDFLFAEPTFASGAASVFDLFGELTQYNTSDTAEEADSDALVSDWYITGQDILDAISGVAEQAKE